MLLSNGFMNCINQIIYKKYYDFNFHDDLLIYYDILHYLDFHEKNCN